MPRRQKVGDGRSNNKQQWRSDAGPDLDPLAPSIFRLPLPDLPLVLRFRQVWRVPDEERLSCVAPLYGLAALCLGITRLFWLGDGDIAVDIPDRP